MHITGPQWVNQGPYLVIAGYSGLNGPTTPTAGFISEAWINPYS